MLNNISNVRQAIRTMTGWRMQASDWVRDKIKVRISSMNFDSVYESSLDIEGLGKVEILKVLNIDNELLNINRRYVNRLLNTEFL